MTPCPSRSARQVSAEVLPFGVLRATSEFNYQPPLNEGFQSGSRGATGKGNGFRDLSGRTALSIFQEAKDGLIPFLKLNWSSWNCGEEHSEVSSNFLKHWCRQSRFLASGSHPLDAATPLLDEAEFVEDAPKDAVPQLRHALLYVLDRQAEWKKAGIFDLNPVFKDGHPNRGATLGIISVDDGVDDRFAEGRWLRISALSTSLDRSLPAKRPA
jgi:hypothetical protein